MQTETKLVCGVGVNDAGYPVSIYAVIHGKQKQLWRCPFYRAWMHMIERCYSAKVHARQPTYAGCSVAPEWHSFSAFREWMAGQPWEGSDLDKDSLVPGNKVYSPDTCVFISHALNKFLNDNAAARGEWPLGVSWHKGRGKFKAQCRNPFAKKNEYLGLFDCPGTAYEVWRARKHQHACRYADQQTDQRIANALRSRYAR